MERVERGDTTHIASSEYGSEINWDQAPTLEMAVERDGVGELRFLGPLPNTDTSIQTTNRWPLQPYSRIDREGRKKL